jgi:HJR/Mrr/RecB family endonuclease
VAKRRDGVYDPDAPTWVKIKNRNYSQAVGRHERFETMRGIAYPYELRAAVAARRRVIPGRGLAFEIEQHNRRVRQKLHANLLKMDPGEFEDLVGRLLAELGFEGIEVTRRSGDGGTRTIRHWFVPRTRTESSTVKLPARYCRMGRP